jgi:hypothetical protein
MQEIHLLAGGGSCDGVALILRREPELVEARDDDGCMYKRRLT